MNNRRRAVQPTDDDILAVVEPVRRVTLLRTQDADRTEDVVQETLTRVLAARHRLDGRALTPYALSVARNLVVSEHRRRELDERYGPRLHEPDETPDAPADFAEQRAEAAALNAALRDLPDEDRALLSHKELAGRDLAALAAERNTTPEALAARLARLRARLRVDYLLNLRRITLPTPACRPVLITLSGGQQRRRRARSVKKHLDQCQSCAGLAGIVEGRRRPIAGLLPLPFLVAGWDWLRGAAGRHPWQTAAASGTVAAVVVGAVLLAQPDPAPPPAARPPAAAPELVNVNARVLSVPADEGFWIAQPPGRVWVQMSGSGESAQRITAGATVQFSALRVPHRPGFARTVGVPPGPDATALDAAGVHLEVPRTQVRVS